MHASRIGNMRWGMFGFLRGRSENKAESEDCERPGQSKQEPERQS